MFKLVVFCLFLVVAFYCIILLAGALSTGSDQKDKMIYKSEEVLGKQNKEVESGRFSPCSCQHKIPARMAGILCIEQVWLTDSS